MKKILYTTLFLLLPLTVYSHGMHVSVNKSFPAVTVSATYMGNEPVSYASILVYSPADNETEYQNGRSDAAGMFAFIPDRAGKWKFVIDDEMGHMKEVEIDVSEEFFSNPEKETLTESGDNTLLRLLAGLGILLGLTGIFFWIKAHRLLKEREYDEA